MQILSRLLRHLLYLSCYFHDTLCCFYIFFVFFSDLKSFSLFLWSFKPVASVIIKCFLSLLFFPQLVSIPFSSLKTKPLIFILGMHVQACKEISKKPFFLFAYCMNDWGQMYVLWRRGSICNSWVHMYAYTVDVSIIQTVVEHHASLRHV